MSQQQLWKLFEIRCKSTKQHEYRKIILCSVFSYASVSSLNNDRTTLSDKLTEQN